MPSRNRKRHSDRHSASSLRCSSLASSGRTVANHSVVMACMLAMTVSSCPAPPEARLPSLSSSSRPSRRIPLPAEVPSRTSRSWPRSGAIQSAFPRAGRPARTGRTASHFCEAPATTSATSSSLSLKNQYRELAGSAARSQTRATVTPSYPYSAITSSAACRKACRPFSAAARSAGCGGSRSMTISLSAASSPRRSAIASRDSASIQTMRFSSKFHPACRRRK